MTRDERRHPECKRRIYYCDEEKDKLDSQVIATDGIAVIVNKNNTTDELSSDQVKTIYTGDATTWDEVVK